MLVLLGIAAVRLIWPDRWFLLVLANAYTFWIYLPGYGLAVVAGFLRRSALLGIALLVVALHLWWVLPDYWPADSVPTEAWSAPRLRLFTANLSFENPDVAAIVEEARQADPDVVLFQEFTGAAEAAVNGSGLAEKLPYQVSAPAGPFGTAIFSRYPLEDAETWDVAGVPMARATVVVEGKRMRVYNVHTVSPTSSANTAAWNREWRLIVDAVRQEHGEVIVAGDFNATQHHRWYGELEHLSLHPAHEERGRGNATTWPNGGRKLRPIRIDHVFLSAGLVTLTIHEGEGKGSDHRPVIADVAILR